jgi:sugar lactone lactonase YvrE
MRSYQLRETLIAAAVVMLILIFPVFTSTAVTPVSAAAIFEAGNCSGTITAYPKNGSGNIAPDAPLKTQLAFPTAIARDSSGKIYVANTCGKGAGIGAGQPGGNATINIYAGGSSGNAAPVGVIGGSKTGLTDVFGIALDSKGNIYVANEAPDSIRIFAAGSNGNISPTAVISGSNTGLNFPAGVFVNSGGRIYVANSASVLVFAPGSKGNVAPIANISGSNTGLAVPDGIAVDSSGSIYVANKPSSGTAGSGIVVFASGSHGNATPIARITGSNTDLADPVGIALDQSANIYVANNPQPGILHTGSIVMFAAGAKGNASPLDTISGLNTGLSNPTGVMVDSSHNIYVSNFYGGGGEHGSVTIYAAGSNGNAAPGAAITNPDVGLTGPTAMALDASGNIYVTNMPPWSSSSSSIPAPATGASITVYPTGSVAGVPPTAKISGPNTMLSFPVGVAVDQTRKIYAVNDYHPYISNSDYSVVVYAPGSSGDVKPEARISGSNTGLFNPVGLAVDAGGNIYVANRSPSSVTVFRSGSTGNVAPSATIDTACIPNPTDPFRSGEIQSIAVDSARNIYVTCIDPVAVNMFAAGSKGNVTPTASISGSNTGITGPGGIAVDSSGEIYVANPPLILVFAPGSKGNSAPVRTIGGPLTPLALIGSSIALQP